MHRWGTGTEWRRPATLSGRGRVIRFCLAGLVSAVAVSCSEEPTTAPARDQSIAGQIAFVQSTTGDSVDRAALEALWTATDGAAWFTRGDGWGWFQGGQYGGSALVRQTPHGINYAAIFNRSAKSGNGYPLELTLIIDELRESGRIVWP